MRASASWVDDPSITKGEASQRRALVQSFMSKLAKERNEMLGWHWTPPKNFLESVVESVKGKYLENGSRMFDNLSVEVAETQRVSTLSFVREDLRAMWDTLTDKRGH